jgi:hypothetical protein
MWVAATFATIALLAAGFMVWFLIALLRERSRTTDCSVVRVRRMPTRETLVNLGRIRADDDYYARQFKGGGYYLDLLESEGHAEEYSQCATRAIRVKFRRSEPIRCRTQFFLR